MSQLVKGRIQGTNEGDAPVLVDNTGAVILSHLDSSGGTTSLPVTLEGGTAQDDLQLAQSANSTTTGTTFPALGPTTTTPVASSSRAVLIWAGRDNLLLIPFGKSANDQTLRFRVTGWQKIGTLWVPNVLCDGTATLSTLTGVAATSVDNTNFFADLLTVDAGIGVVRASPADDTGIAAVEVPIGPYDLVEIQFIRNGSAAEANALVSTY